MAACYPLDKNFFLTWYPTTGSEPHLLQPRSYQSNPSLQTAAMLSPCLQCSPPSPCPANPVHPTGHHFRTPGLCAGLFQMPPEHQHLSPPHPVLMEKAIATHSSTLAWKIPWAEEPGGLQSMGSRRVGHDWVTSLSRIGEGNGSQLQCSCLENPRDGGAWWAAI